MNRRNFITTGLVGALPLPSIGFAGAKPTPQPKTLNELLVKLEQDTQYLIKSKIESWGFEVIDVWPTDDNLYVNGTQLVYPKLRWSTNFDFDEADSVSRIVQDCVCKYSLLINKVNFVNKVFLKTQVEYEKPTESKPDGTITVCVSYDWVRHDSIKAKNKEHLREILSGKRPHAHA